MLEVVVAFGIAMVIIGSLVTLINASNRRATLARQATQASNLAQQGMEIVRNIRDVDVGGALRGVGTSSINPGCVAPSYCKWSDLYTAEQLTFPSRLAEPDSADCPITTSWCLVTGAPETITLGGTANYERTVVISDEEVDTNGDGSPDAICSDFDLSYDQTKRITVRVTWHSPIGDQKKMVESCLTNWR